MAIQTSGVQLFGDPVGVREFRCVGSVNKWGGADVDSTNKVLKIGSTAHSLLVPRAAYRRNIWLAFDALRSSTVAPWYMAGRLGFWLNGSKITEFPISKGYHTPSGGINIFAPSTGAGMQPSLRATALETYAADYKSVDMPCFTFDVECDKITLDIDAIILGGTYLRVTDVWLIDPGDMQYTQDLLDQYGVIGVNGVSAASANQVGPCAGLFTSKSTAGRINDIKAKLFVSYANNSSSLVGVNWRSQPIPTSPVFCEMAGAYVNKASGSPPLNSDSHGMVWPI